MAEEAFRTNQLLEEQKRELKAQVTAAHDSRNVATEEHMSGFLAQIEAALASSEVTADDAARSTRKSWWEETMFVVLDLIVLGHVSARVHSVN